MRLMSDVTLILGQIEQGDASATERLLPLLYEELRQLAARKLVREKPGQTLQTTALVHEAFVRLVKPRDAQSWNSRGHFFAAAAEAMRRILIEQARRKASERHGGGRKRIDLDDAVLCSEEPSDDVEAISEALDRLHGEDPRKAELVKLRYFAGLTIAEAAEAMNISVATAERYWAYSRLRLFQWVRER